MVGASIYISPAQLRYSLPTAPILSSTIPAPLVGRCLTFQSRPPQQERYTLSPPQVASSISRSLRPPRSNGMTAPEIPNGPPGGNWYGGSPPNAVGQSALFGVNSPSGTVTLTSPETVSGIIFNNGGLSYALGGTGNLILNNGVAASRDRHHQRHSFYLGSHLPQRTHSTGHHQQWRRSHHQWQHYRGKGRHSERSGHNHADGQQQLHYRYREQQYAERRCRHDRYACSGAVTLTNGSRFKLQHQLNL